MTIEYKKIANREDRIKERNVQKARSRKVSSGRRSIKYVALVLANFILANWVIILQAGPDSLRFLHWGSHIAVTVFSAVALYFIFRKKGATADERSATTPPPGLDRSKKLQQARSKSRP